MLVTALYTATGRSKKQILLGISVKNVYLYPLTHKTV